MSHHKCNDCPTKEPPNVIFDWLKNLSNKQIFYSFSGLISAVFVFAFLAGGFTTDQLSINEDVCSMKEKVINIELKLTSIEVNLNILAEHLKNKGSIPENSCFNNADTTNLMFVDISKPDDERKRLSAKQTACDFEDIETKILK